MKMSFATLALLGVTIGAMHAEARTSGPRGLWSNLDRDGAWSAGWVQVLPDLATTCRMRLDTRELNAKIVDISQTAGNTSYATDLYWNLYLMDRHRAHNPFVRAWTARFGSDQKAACDKAENLWGTAGQQFPGVLKREAAIDTDAAGPPSQPTLPNCR